MKESHTSQTITAAGVSSEIRVDSANPAKEWEKAEPVRFAADWQGKNTDPALATEVRVLWSPMTLYLRFVCRYRELFVFDDSDPNGRRDHLWDRDVAEAFLQTPESMGRKGQDARPSTIKYENVEKDFDAPYARYKEFEIAPNGMWIDLDIVPSGRGDLRSGLTCSVHLDDERRIWTAEMAIPMKSLTSNFDPSERWRANFYRVEGRVEPRNYMAWQPTMAPEPNFHIPEKFGHLRFS